MFEMARKTPLLDEIYLALIEIDKPMTAQEIAIFINSRCRFVDNVTAKNVLKCIRTCKQAPDYINRISKNTPYLFEYK